MSFFERAKAAASDLAAKADVAMTNAGISVPGIGPDRALRDLGVVAWMDATGRQVADADRERVMATVRELDAAGRLGPMTLTPPPTPYGSQQTPYGAPPPPPGAAGQGHPSPPPPGGAAPPPPPPPAASPMMPAGAVPAPSPIQPPAPLPGSSGPAPGEPSLSDEPSLPDEPPPAATPPPPPPPSWA